MSTTGSRRARASFADFHHDDRVARPTMAQLCGVSERTAEDWFRRGFGPPASKLGPSRSARVVYRVGDIRDWLDAQRRSSTTADPEAVAR